mmetsp:Transcript_10694/g.35812  ORF Transcript_10694/g.35812 Transcript_10694/m.35812 type:complete len:165 (+) Transcript_10694:889-1383(+)
MSSPNKLLTSRMICASSCLSAGRRCSERSKLSHAWRQSPTSSSFGFPLLSVPQCIRLTRGVQDPKDPTQREAERLFRTIDSLGNSNGFLELYEVILYIQEYMQHMFYKKNSMGDNVVDEKKLKDFASNLRNLVDTNKDGAISLEEFVQGFVTWKHFIEEQEKAS